MCKIDHYEFEMKETFLDKSLASFFNWVEV